MRKEARAIAHARQAKRLFCGDAREALYSMRNKRADLDVIAQYCKNTAQYWHACFTLRARFTRVSTKFPLASALASLRY